jgi:hypothetical protein
MVWRAVVLIFTVTAIVVCAAPALNVNAADAARLVTISESTPLELADGSRYAGTVLDMIPHGYGVLQTRDGLLYKGPFQHGKKHGDGGYMEMAKGAGVYEGQFQNDRCHGKGTLSAPDGSKYTVRRQGCDKVVCG